MRTEPHNLIGIKMIGAAKYWGLNNKKSQSLMTDLRICSPTRKAWAPIAKTGFKASEDEKNYHLPRISLNDRKSDIEDTK